MKTACPFPIATDTPIRKRHRELISDHGELECLMRLGAEKARAISEPILADVKRKMVLIV